jgi:hypothetical protein
MMRRRPADLWRGNVSAEVESEIPLRSVHGDYRRALPFRVLEQQAAPIGGAVGASQHRHQYFRTMGPLTPENRGEEVWP